MGFTAVQKLKRPSLWRFALQIMKVSFSLKLTASFAPENGWVGRLNFLLGMPTLFCKFGHFGDTFRMNFSNFKTKSDFFSRECQTDSERIKPPGDLPGLRAKRGDYFTYSNPLFTFQIFHGYLDRLAVPWLFIAYPLTASFLCFHGRPIPCIPDRIFVEAVQPFSIWQFFPINRGISSNSMATRWKERVHMRCIVPWTTTVDAWNPALHDEELIPLHRYIPVSWFRPLAVVLEILVPVI